MTGLPADRPEPLGGGLARASLGFTVPELVRAGRGGGGLRMGLTRVAEAGWLQPQPDLATRAEIIARHPDAIFVLPEAEAAARETAALLGVSGGLAEAAHACWEDLCLLQSRGNAYALTAGAVAFPTDWRLEEKLGLPMAGVHAPIHGYAEQLAAGVDHFMRELKPGPIFGRANWFVVPSPEWRWLPEGEPATRFAHVTAANAGDTLFVRCERQTLRRLPETGAILFTIGIAVEPLKALPAETVSRVASAVASVPEGEGQRRAAPFYAEALARYAASRQEENEDAA